MGTKNTCWLIAAILIGTFAVPEVPLASRIKDLAYFKGNRANQLIGYGLLVGLNATGDKTKTQFTVNTLANLLENAGIHVDPKAVKVKNVAAVMVTANLPPFARSGSRIDAQVSSIGDATSLQGGTLLMTPLQGPDGKTYAVAQGPVSLGGFSASGGGGSSVQKNHPTVGFISAGALVEREVSMDYAEWQHVELVLRVPDFTTATKAAQSINAALGSSRAQALDAATVRIQMPAAPGPQLVELLSRIENVQVTPEVVARVIINERTGTVVMGENVRIAPVAVAHGNLTVQITEEPVVSQPLPFSRGRTAVVPNETVEAQEQKGSLALIGGGVNIAQVVKGLNALGVTPRDLITIMQAIKAAGALQGELEII
jgi:flagellar P-ring protein precursor FlgI